MLPAMEDGLRGEVLSTRRGRAGPSGEGVSPRGGAHETAARRAPEVPESEPEHAVPIGAAA